MRRKNTWVILELFLVFIIMWYIVDFFSVMGITATTPIGADITNVYQVVYATNKSNNPKYISYEEGSDEPGQNFLRMVERLKEHPDVTSVCIGSWFYPYCTASSSSRYINDTLRAQYRKLSVSPEYFSMFHVTPVDGGDPEILARAIRKESAVILSKKAEKDLFKDGSGIGKTIMTGDGRDTIYLYVSGVCNEMKTHEYTRPQSYALSLFDESRLFTMDDEDIRNRVSICIKVKPGVSAKDFPTRFKEEMKHTLTIGNFFLADINPLAAQRELYLRAYDITTTLKYRIGFAIFFLINIFLAVLGTFWLRIERRRSEIGLRMAIGSTEVQIMKLILTEGLCMMVIASIPALLVCVNMVFIEFMPVKNMDFTLVRFLSNTGITYLLFIVAITLSSLYPARRSAHIQPAEALHYE